MACGAALTEDDCLRREVIKTLICNFSFDSTAIETQRGIRFGDYFFAEDLTLLKPLIADGLVVQTATGLQVTGVGRLLIRNICMCFDRYLRQKARQ